MSQPGSLLSSETLQIPGRRGSSLNKTSDPLLGETIDRYRIDAKIGEGAMGRVYAAHHVRVGRRFAIKVMSRTSAPDKRLRDRFTHEAKTAALLEHPNLAAVLDFGETQDGLLYLVMEYVKGPSLLEILKTAPLPESRVISLSLQLARGLGHAHDRNLIHRDLKPENILVSQQDGLELAKIVDFGIARSLEADREKFTKTGHIVGTPEFMAPEQATSGPLGPHTDLFCLGLIMYRMAAGVAPFGLTGINFLREMLTQEIPKVSTRNPKLAISPKLESIIEMLLQKETDARIRSAKTLIELLEDAKRTPLPAAQTIKTVTVEGPALKRPYSPEFKTPRLFLSAGLLVLTSSLAFVLGTQNAQEPITPASPTPSAMPQETVQSPPPPVSTPVLAPAVAAPVEVPVKAPTKEPKAEATAPKTAPKTSPKAPKRQARRKRPQPPTTVSRDAVRKLYEQVGGQLGRLIERNPKRAAPLETQYYRIPFMESIKDEDLRPAVKQELETLKKKINKALLK